MRCTVHRTPAKIQGSHTRSAGCVGPLLPQARGAVYLHNAASLFHPLSAARVPPRPPPPPHFLKDRPCAVPLIAIYLICIWLFHYNSLNLSSHVARATESRLACSLTRSLAHSGGCRGDPGISWSSSSCAVAPFPPPTPNQEGVVCSFLLLIRSVSTHGLCDILACPRLLDFSR